ncbi:hypothetical protein GCM10009682_58700 [Luedemannella flava]|uniref:Uncharacterized protein n=1 Tax=Luedemannella flava TaxID=349316 RepID=A0ABN2MNP9_9ACTN
MRWCSSRAANWSSSVPAPMSAVFMGYLPRRGPMRSTIGRRGGGRQRNLPEAKELCCWQIPQPATLVLY